MRTSPKNIVLSTYTFLPDIGGVATNTLTIAEALTSRGYNVTIITLTKNLCIYDNKFEIVRNPNIFQLVKIYRNSDWILLSNLSSKLNWPLVFLKKTTALHHHSSSAFFRKNTNKLTGYLKQYFENKIIKKSIHFVNSEFTKNDGGIFFNHLQTYTTYPIVKYTHISNNVLDKFEEKSNALFVGRIEEEKGVPYLLQYIDTIRAMLVVDKLTFIGSGTLLNQLKNKNIEGVEFIGAKDITTVMQLMQGADYVLVPSIWHEPFGMVALEGLASGSIVISSNRGGLPEAVGECGYLFDINSLESFENALREARNQKERLTNLSLLTEYVKTVNSHLDQFSSDNVITIMIEALIKAETNEPS